MQRNDLFHALLMCVVSVLLTTSCAVAESPTPSKDSIGEAPTTLKIHGKAVAVKMRGAQNLGVARALLERLDRTRPSFLDETTPQASLFVRIWAPPLTSKSTSSMFDDEAGEGACCSYGPGWCICRSRPGCEDAAAACYDDPTPPEP
jgi:hypothetical protein